MQISPGGGHSGHFLVDVVSKSLCLNGHVVFRLNGHVHTEHHEYRVKASVM